MSHENEKYLTLFNHNWSQATQLIEILDNLQGYLKTLNIVVESDYS